MSEQAKNKAEISWSLGTKVFGGAMEIRMLGKLNDGNNMSEPFIDITVNGTLDFDSSRYFSREEFHYEVILGGFFSDTPGTFEKIEAKLPFTVNRPVTVLGTIVGFSFTNLESYRNCYFGEVPRDGKIEYYSISVNVRKKTENISLNSLTSLCNPGTLSISTSFDSSREHSEKVIGDYGTFKCSLKLDCSKEKAEIVLYLQESNFDTARKLLTEKKFKISAITQLTVAGMKTPKKENLELCFNDLSSSKRILVEMPKNNHKKNRKFFVLFQISFVKFEVLELKELVEEKEEEAGTLSLTHYFTGFSSDQSKSSRYRNLEWTLGYSSHYPSQFYLSIEPLYHFKELRFWIRADVQFCVGDQVEHNLKLDQIISKKILIFKSGKKVLCKTVETLITLKLSEIRIEKFGFEGAVETIFESDENCFRISETFRKELNVSQMSPYHRRENTEWSLHLRPKDDYVQFCLFVKPSEDFLCPVEEWEITADVGRTVNGYEYQTVKDMSFRFDHQKNICFGKLLLDEPVEQFKKQNSTKDSFSATVKIWNIRTKNIRKFGALNFRNSFLEDSDMKILIGEENVFCHSQILSLSSPVFKNLIRTRRENSVEITLPPGHSIEDFFQFLHQLYFPTEPIRDKNWRLLLVFAKAFKVCQIDEACEDFLLKSLKNNENTFIPLEIFIISWNFDLERLKEFYKKANPSIKSVSTLKKLTKSSEYFSMNDERKLKMLQFLISNMEQ